MWNYQPVDAPWQSIITDGHRVGLQNLSLTVGYPQRQFTNEQLDEASEKPESELAEAEAEALWEYDNAITLGLRQFGFNAKSKSCLDLLYAKKAWALLDTEVNEQPYPYSAGPVASFYLTPTELLTHGLEPREY